MKYVHCYQSFLCQVQSQKKAVDLLSGLVYHVDLKTVKSYILIIITLIHQRLSHRITRHFLLLKWGFFNSAILLYYSSFSASGKQDGHHVVIQFEEDVVIVVCTDKNLI